MLFHVQNISLVLKLFNVNYSFLKKTFFLILHAFNPLYVYEQSLLSFYCLLNYIFNKDFHYHHDELLIFLKSLQSDQSTYQFGGLSNIVECFFFL